MGPDDLALEHQHTLEIQRQSVDVEAHHGFCLAEPDEGDPERGRCICRADEVGELAADIVDHPCEVIRRKIPGIDDPKWYRPRVGGDLLGSAAVVDHQPQRVVSRDHLRQGLPQSIDIEMSLELRIGVCADAPELERRVTSGQ